MNRSSRTFLRRHLPVVLTLCAGVGLSLALFVQARQAELRNLQLAFDSRGNAIENAVSSLVAAYLEAIHSIAGFYAASHQIDRHEFAAFTQRMLREYPGIRMLGWAPRIERTRIAAHEASAVAEFRLEPGYQVRAAADGGFWVFPILFAEPSARNRSLLGLDLGSVSGAFPTIDRAIERGVMGVTGQVEVAGMQFDCMIALPVYRKGAPTFNNGQRRQNLEGLIIGMLAFSPMLSSGLRSVDLSGQVVRLREDPDQGGAILFSSADGHIDPPPAASPLAPWQRKISIGNRDWVLQGDPTPGYLDANPLRGPWLALGAGLICSTLAAAYVNSLTGRAEATRRLVELRTAELRQSEQRHRAVVEQAGEGITLVDAQDLRLLEVNQAFARLLGYERHELVGRPIADFIVDTPEGVAARAEHTLVSGPNVTRRQYRRKDGTVIDVVKSATVLDLGGKRVICTVIHDITEQLRAQ
ncbi:MAG: CHASE domain-containing protein, partial [Phycisphaerae bacterium]|nr:CHASE domain-containing protein [Phycisphaerae bacterium]